MTKQLCPICEKQQTIVSGNKGATGKGGIKTLQLEGQHFFFNYDYFLPSLKALITGYSQRSLHIPAWSSINSYVLFPVWINTLLLFSGPSMLYYLPKWYQQLRNARGWYPLSFSGHHWQCNMFLSIHWLRSQRVLSKEHC